MIEVKYFEHKTEKLYAMRGIVTIHKGIHHVGVIPVSKRGLCPDALLWIPTGGQLTHINVIPAINTTKGIHLHLTNSNNPKVVEFWLFSQLSLTGTQAEEFLELIMKEEVVPTSERNDKLFVSDKTLFTFKENPRNTDTSNHERFCTCEDCKEPQYITVEKNPIVTVYQDTPEIVQALQYNGDNKIDIIQFTNNRILSNSGSSMLTVDTQRATMRYIKIGDYVVRRDMNDYYAYPKDEFEDKFRKYSDKQPLVFTASEQIFSAIQCTPNNFEEIKEFANGNGRDIGDGRIHLSTCPSDIVPTFWLVKNKDGKLSVQSDSYFKANMSQLIVH